MRTKKINIEKAKLRFISQVLGKGGDNFRWVGVGKVKISFIGRGGTKRALREARP